MEIRPIDFTDPCVLALLAEPLSGMTGDSPPEHVHALDVSGLQHPSVTVLGAWQGEALLAFGAIKQIAPDQAEIKSVYTAAPQNTHRSGFVEGPPFAGYTTNAFS